MLAMISVFVAFVPPLGLIQHWKKTEALFDAIGLSAFAIQGSICYANESPHERGDCGRCAYRKRRGMVRDLLAGRKPLVLRDEIYAVWAMIAGSPSALAWPPRLGSRLLCL